ncbi:uncharacterized protein BDV17DRAFT_192453 [Aspergillus undulatus]|uniref:uncharacterized protein n=1 Tax=Aspergillus undulatus TaxID=1810928 RepID=UPI003CCE1C5E
MEHGHGELSLKRERQPWNNSSEQLRTSRAEDSIRLANPALTELTSDAGCLSSDPLRLMSHYRPSRLKHRILVFTPNWASDKPHCLLQSSSGRFRQMVTFTSRSLFPFSLVCDNNVSCRLALWRLFSWSPRLQNNRWRLEASKPLTSTRF